jgi:hypothetical protein
MKTVDHFNKAALLVAATSLALLQLSSAASIQLGGPLPLTRTATLTSAESGTTGEGNATVSDVQAAYNFATWTERGEETSSGATGWLDIALTSGTFGSQPAAGTWTITNNAFWTTFGAGAISMHAGGGQGTPDHFIWLLTPGQLSGTWSYDGGTANGGGLSNLKLYSNSSRPDPRNNRVPDGGTTIICLGMALLGLGSMKRLTVTKA